MAGARATELFQTTRGNLVSRATRNCGTLIHKAREPLVRAQAAEVWRWLKTGKPGRIPLCHYHSPHPLHPR